MDTSQLLALANIAMGGILAGFDLYYYRRNPGEPWRWIKLVYAVVGLYWAGIYVYVALAEPGRNPVTFGQVFIRPALTITLAVMAAGSIIRVKNYRSNGIR